MELSARLAELQKRVAEHRTSLLTEEAAKTAFVMPFLQALGYDVFNPGEVIPEFTADVGTKKGEKVDYAICSGGKMTMLIECKPVTASLNVNHASQLFRYFSVTDARVALLTNGIEYQFFSDTEKPNKMDDRPFFAFTMDALRPHEIRTIEKFAKSAFNIESIVQEAGNLKLQSLLRKALETEFSEPSEEFVKLMASRVYEGRLTPGLKDTFSKMLVVSIKSLVRDMVTDRLSSALNASAPSEVSLPEAASAGDDDGTVTTPEENAGFHIVQAIAARLIDPKRVFMRDAKSYCAVLLDDNNRKPIARLHFNSLSAKYIETFTGKNEGTRHATSDLRDIYNHAITIEGRLKELDPSLG